MRATQQKGLLSEYDESQILTKKTMPTLVASDGGCQTAVWKSGVYMTKKEHCGETVQNI